MKEGVHPKYHPVVFVDGEHEILSRSTLTSAEKRVIDGVPHFVVHLDVSSFTHPFFTGKQHLIDTEGRIDRFRRKYKGAKTPGKKEPAVEAKAEPVKAEPVKAEAAKAEPAKAETKE